MKKIILICVPVLFLLTNCGPSTTEIKKDIEDSIAANDSIKNKQEVFDPMAPPTPDYSGDHIVKYPNGITQVRGFFRFGKRHGKWASFYDTGELWSETEYNNGVKEGTTIVWYKNGKKQYEGAFKNDEREGNWIFYDSTGKVIETKKIDEGMIK